MCEEWLDWSGVTRGAIRETGILLRDWIVEWCDGRVKGAIERVQGNVRRCAVATKGMLVGQPIA